MYDELISSLREEAEWAAGNEWETPIMLYDHLKQAADAIQELQRLVEANKTPRWIPVTERLPEAGVYVLAYSADDDYMTVEAKHKFEAFQITHWIPLPQPPKEET